VVHMPQMEDEPRETFEDPAKLFAAIGISLGGIKDDTPDYSSPSPQVTPSPSSTPPPSATKRSSFDANLSYEERVALRKAEREERRRQRAVAT